MSAVCELCGKGAQFGNTLSRTGTRGYLKKRSKRKFSPNLRKVRVMVDGEIKRMKVCAKCLKSRKISWEEAQELEEAE
ncbi:MAG: 50S ribosomal protein L28 [Patescibacteria group bacterium]